MEASEDPDDFLEDNCFDEVINRSALVASLMKLTKNIQKVLLTPIKARGDRL